MARRDHLGHLAGDPPAGSGMTHPGKQRPLVLPARTGGYESKLERNGSSREVDSSVARSIITDWLSVKYR